MDTIVLFTEGWFNDMIAQTQRSFGDTTPDGHALATAQLVGLCCVAQAIDQAFRDHESGNTMLSAVRDIACELGGNSDE
jgi:hypothetical protein